MQDTKNLLTIGEASEYLGVSIDTLRRWEKRKKLEVFRSPGGHRYFSKNDLDKLFGKKYERDEIDKKQLITNNKQKAEEFGEEKHEQLEGPVEEVKGEEIKQDTKTKLEVPRYIRYHTISKYEKLFGNIQSFVVKKVDEPTRVVNYPKVTSFAHLSIKTEINEEVAPKVIVSPTSVLTPLTPLKNLSTGPDIGRRVEKSKGLIGWVIEQKTWIIIGSVILLTILLVILIISLSSSRILSPVP